MTNYDMVKELPDNYVAYYRFEEYLGCKILKLVTIQYDPPF